LASPESTREGTLAGLLDQELRSLRTFVTLLVREQDLLGAAAVDALSALAAEKSAMATNLAQFAAARDAELGRLGLPAGRSGMAAWLGSKAATGLTGQWNQLLVLAAEARALNETNGKLIGIQLQNNQQALSVLMSAADQAVTYGPDGQQKAGSGGRSLGSA
jgi:flagellar biosynthesis protein FlgN